MRLLHLAAEQGSLGAQPSPNLHGVSSAPAWVTYAALLLSALSLLVSAMTYRAGGPRLRLEAVQLLRGDDRFPGGSGVRLTVINAGRAAVTVQSFAVTPYGERKPAIPIKDVQGPALPHRLEPNASETWEADALPPAREYDSLIRSGRLKPYSSWPSLFRVTVIAGNGKRASTRHTFDSLRLIADSQDGLTPDHDR